LWTGALAVAGLFSIVAWCVLVPGAPFWEAATALTVASVAAVNALWQWWRTASGLLRFDGSAWVFDHNNAPGGVKELAPASVTVVLDWQQAVLVSMMSGTWKRHRWIWLERRSDPASWHALRCAIYVQSQRRPETGVTRPMLSRKAHSELGGPR
jgi:hypothetical protein